MNRNNRVEYLEKLLASGKADSFARYALALEYEKAERPDEAVRVFSELRELDPSYLPMYFMAGQLLSRLGRIEPSLEWLRTGAELAKKKGDGKAYSELTGLIETLGGR